METDFNLAAPPAAPAPRKARVLKVWEGAPTVFLSCGGGVQSSRLVMAAVRGGIERLNHVIFADPGWERQTTYQTLEYLREQCRRISLPFHIVRATGRALHIRWDTLRNRTDTGIGRWDGRMPLFVDSKRGGQLPRQCSVEYKIRPIRGLQRRLMGYGRNERIPVGHAVTLIGFSTDEIRRVSQSQDVWNENQYPLIEARWSRGDCQTWWDKHYPRHPLSSSACIGCPYRRDWARMQRETPDEFSDACDFDLRIRQVAGVRSRR